MTESHIDESPTVRFIVNHQDLRHGTPFWPDWYSQNYTRECTGQDLGSPLAAPAPLKLSYEAAKKRAEPYTKIVGELPDMRRDTVQIVRQAVRSEGRRAYVLVNNRAEGNAPLTVQGLVEGLTQ